MRNLIMLNMRDRVQEKPPRVRRGFTLVELLVVIAIIGVLVALLLPAVQAARAAARRSQCQNNLKNLGLGLQNYHSAFGEFPVGFVAEVGTTDEADWAWSSYLLPYIEQQGLYDQLDVANQRLLDVIINPNTRHLPQALLPVFQCPEDEANVLLPGGSNEFSPPFERHFNCKGCPSAPDFEVGKSNYVASSGFYDTWDHELHNGAFIGNKSISISEITDGTSNTLALGERDRRCRQAAWCGNRNPRGPNMWGTYFVRGRVSIKLNDPRDIQIFESQSCTEGFSSSHAGGAMFVYCDGSVHFINDDISFENGGLRERLITDQQKARDYDIGQLGVYQKLGIRDDGAVIGEEI